MALNRRTRFQQLSVSEQEAAMDNLARCLEDDEETDPFAEEDNDEDYVPNDVASDVEVELNVDMADESDSDDDGQIQEDDAACVAVFPPAVADDGSHFISKSGHKWYADPPVSGRIRAHNVVNYTQRRPGPAPGTVVDPLAIFKTIMSDDIAYVIIRETNRKGNEYAAAWNTANPNATPRQWNPLSLKEFHAYLGILLYSGSYRSNSEPVKELWSETHLPLYKAAMAKNRFCAINRTIRFDNSNTRAARLLESKTAAIDDIWTMMMANLERAYTPHESMTVDEQLFPYRGRTRFTQYIPSKPAKYGIKVWWLCDSQSYYPLKGVIYSGKQPNEGRQINQGQRVVLNLVQRYERSGRTIYADNFFTTLELALHLKAKELAFVGTVRSNKTFVPPEFLRHKSREVYSTLFGFYQGDVSLCSYVPRKNKAVLLLSTQHYTTRVDDANPKKKPIAVLDYNSNKCGVDTMDQMLGTYSCKRATKRWPLAMFYNIVDIAGLASFIVHDELITTRQTDKRRSFLKILSRQLVMPNIEERSKNTNVTRYPKIRGAMEAFRVMISPSISDAAPPLAPRGNRPSCRLCRQESNKQRKTAYICFVCRNPVCVEHSSTLKKCDTCSSTDVGAAEGTSRK